MLQILRQYSLLVLLWLYTCYPALSQNRVIDSLRLWLKTNTQADSQRAVTLHKLSYRLAEINLKESWEVANEANTLANKIENKSNIGQSYINFAILEAMGGNYAESQSHYKQAIVLFQQSGWLRGQAICLNNMAENYKITNDLSNALNYTFKALEINKKLGENRGQAINYEQIGVLLLKLNQKEKAEGNLQKGYDLAAKYAKEDLIYPQLLLSMARCYRLSNRIALAQKYLSDAMGIAKLQNEKFLEIAISKEQANLYMAQNKPTEAIYTLEKTLQMAGQFDSQVEVAQIHELLANLYKKQGNHAAALANQEAFKTVSDSLKTADNKAKLTYLDVFERLKANQLLKTTKVEQEAALSKQAIWITSLAALLCLALLGFIWLLYRNRIRKLAYEHLKQDKSLQQLAISEKIRLQIARDLHDDLGATLSSIAMMSKAAKKQLEPSQQKTTDILDNISTNALQAIGTIREIIWTTRHTEGEMGQIAKKMQQFANETLSPINTAYTFEIAPNLQDYKLPPNHYYNLYMVFKEVIANVAKHAQARHVDIDIRSRRNFLEMKIEDNGIGLDLKTDKTRGNGLFNIQKRIEELGGSVIIESMLAIGTAIVVSIPMTIEANDTKITQKVLPLGVTMF